ncbi:hypothetical protein J7K19_12835 [bacterium]|nr:hypothetical protein [bacterium]
MRSEKAHYYGNFNYRQPEKHFCLAQNSLEKVEVHDLAFHKSLVEECTT